MQRINFDLLGYDKAIELCTRAVSWPGVEVVDVAKGPFEVDGDDPRGVLVTRVLIDSPKDVEAYQHLLDCVTAINRWYLANGWRKHRLYRSGVRYEPEPLGLEIWQTVPTLYLRKFGDCEDLACARAAEIGGRAVIERAGNNPSGGRNFHIVVRKGRRREDPSKRLGMK